MSSSPLDPTRIAEVKDPQGPYRRSILAVDELMERGFSLSGHERNVCFLNLGRGDGRFATASAVTGFDFDDDARAVVPVDWDGDGDLDVWLANRTAPMLRFLKNTHCDGRASGEPADWVTFRLVATRGVRDAIGGRVTVRLGGGGQMVRVLKAGEGFLTQTGKSLHFGLGEAGKIQSVVVRWPGRAEERFAGVEAGRQYLLQEGAGRAVVVERAQEGRLPPVLAEGAAPLPDGGPVRAVAGSRFPLPVLPWESFAGEKRTSGGRGKGMTLINLWATWCAPCVEELNEFQESEDLLEAAGVKVVALSVDGLVEGGTSTDPAALAAKRAFSFTTGRATPALVRRIERARAHAWGVKWALPVPSSVLVDGDGRLLVLYAGRVTPAQVAADARLAATASPEAWHDAAMPFPGVWIERPNRPIALPLALDLMNEGALDDAQEFCGRAGTELSRHKEYAILLTWIGERLMERGSTAGALQAFESALAADADNVVVLNNLAWQRAAHPDAAVRDAAAAVRLAETAATLTAHQNASVLDTLAAAYAEAGRFTEAVATGEKALILATQSASPEVVQSITKGLSYYRRGRAYGR